MTGVKRILFMSEAATLAHVARPAALYAGLDHECWDAFFAVDAGSRKFLSTDPDRTLPMRSIPSAVFVERLRTGSPLYTYEELCAYGEEDLRLLERVEPDLVVGDFRLSLSVSARRAGVPYACISNAYWSPYAPDRSLPLPVLPWTPFVPVGLAQRIFDRAQPWLLRPHCQPLNELRIAHGLPTLEDDIRRIYTDADYTLYADSARLFPLPALPASHRHIGPVLWSPPVAPPSWWHELPRELPLAYLTLGSSGRADLLQMLIDALADAGLGVICATAGAPLSTRQQPTVWLADYLPGIEAAARARLVVCNGGSPTSQQALAAGVPVLGICGNMDQMMNMRGLVAAGAGVGLRADRVGGRPVRTAILSLLARRAAAPDMTVPGLDASSGQCDFNDWLATTFDGAVPGDRKRHALADPIEGAHGSL